MLNIMEVHETNQMIEQEKLDVRTITMGISLLDCAADSVDEVCDNIYNKITTYAKDLVSTGKAIERDYGIPIVNKRITVTPISLVGASSPRSRSRVSASWWHRRHPVASAFHSASSTFPSRQPRP